MATHEGQRSALVLVGHLQVPDHVLEGSFAHQGAAVEQADRTPGASTENSEFRRWQ